MAYLNTIPQPTDRLQDSQPQLLENFSQIYNLIGVNHGNFNSVDAGKHNFISLPVQGSAPTTGATETCVYSRTSAVTGVPELVFRRASNGTIIEMTTSSLVANNGFAYLPSGLLVKWGNYAQAAAGSTNVIFTGPAYTQIFNVQLSTQSALLASSYAVLTSAPATTDLTIAASASTQVYWMATGI